MSSHAPRRDPGTYVRLATSSQCSQENNAALLSCPMFSLYHLNPGVQVINLKERKLIKLQKKSQVRQPGCSKYTHGNRLCSPGVSGETVSRLRHELYVLRQILVWNLRYSNSISTSSLLHPPRRGAGAR